MNQSDSNLVKIMAFLALILASSISPAAIIIVDRDDDLGIFGDGGCDLRDAVISANENYSRDGCNSGDNNSMDTIIINLAGPIQLTSQIDIDSSMSITPNFNAPRVTLIAASGNRIFNIAPLYPEDDDIQLGRLRLTNGHAGVENGGAILFSIFHSEIERPSITIVDIEFENNYANNGGAIYIDGTKASSLDIINSKFTNNSASKGGAIYGRNITNSSTFTVSDNLFQSNASYNAGGAIWLINNSIGLFTNNLFISNTGIRGGAMYLGSDNTNNTIMEYLLKNNVFLRNQVSSSGGAIYYIGAHTELNIINTTMAFGFANYGGGIYSVDSSSVLNIKNSTLMHNTASTFGANIYRSNGGITRLESNIIAHASSSANCFIESNNLYSLGANISDDFSCDLNHVSDVINDPKLSGLVYHDSGLPGFIPTADSPALDSGSTPDCLDHDGVTIIEFDQQENPRTTDGDGNGASYCDSGAIEAPANTDLIWADSLGG